MCRHAEMKDMSAKLKDPEWQCPECAELREALRELYNENLLRFHSKNADRWRAVMDKARALLEAADGR